jgi:hypothetical protein
VIAYNNIFEDKQILKESMLLEEGIHLNMGTNWHMQIG